MSAHGRRHIVGSATKSSRPRRFQYLDFIARLSDARANSLARAPATHSPDTILDVGCGWGELEMRVDPPFGITSAPAIRVILAKLALGERNASTFERGGGMRSSSLRFPVSLHSPCRVGHPDKSILELIGQ